MSDRILRLPQVKEKTGLSRSSIYALAASDAFPKPISLTGARAVGWLESELEDFLARRAELRSSK